MQNKRTILMIKVKDFINVQNKEIVEDSLDQIKK